MFRLVVALAASAVLALAWSAPPVLADGTLGPQVLANSTAEQSLLDLTNADRALHGLNALVFDPQMIDIARQRAQLQLGPQSLSHYDTAGQLVFVGLLKDASLGYLLAGENLARSSSDDAQVTTRVEDALMHSPPHRQNILEPAFTRVAVGVATDASGQITFAEIYRN